MSATDTADLETILPPDGEPLQIAGVPCRVRRIRTRELLAFLRVIIAGAGQSLPEAQRMIKDGEPADEVLVALAMQSVPIAGDEAIAFVQVIVEPLDEKKAAKVTAALVNPEIDTLWDVIERVIVQEKDEIETLVGKARRFLKNAGKVPIPR